MVIPETKSLHVYATIAMVEHDTSPLATPTPSPVADPASPTIDVTTIDVTTTSSPALSTAEQTNSAPDPSSLPEISSETLSQASAQTKADSLPVMLDPSTQLEIAPRPIMPQHQASTSSSSPGPMPQTCLLYTSPSPRDLSTSRMPSSA